MKKITLLAFMALALCACNKINEVEEEQQTLNPDSPNMVTFTAEFTKTAIDDKDQTATWVAGDEVAFVWNDKTVTANASISGSSTTFSVEIDEGIDELYVVYPSSAAGSYDNVNKKVNVSIANPRPNGSFASNDICVAKAVKTAGVWQTSLTFKNVACLLKIDIDENDGRYDQIQIHGKNKEEAISGTLPVGISGGEVIYGNATGTGTTMNLNSISGTGPFYISVLPNIEFSNGFIIKLLKNNNIVGTPFYYNGSYTTARGKIIKFNSFDKKAGHYYVTPYGGGQKSGQNWSNAMDIAKFKAFVTNSDNSVMLNGSTFHFSADKFSFGDDYLEFDYSKTVALTLEGTVTASDTTTFLGRTNTSEVKAGVLFPKNNSYLTVKNVKFTGTNGVGNSSVIRVNNGAKELTLDHCYFRNNQTNGNGGCISVFNNNAKAFIKNCSFSGNRGAGAVIHVNNTSATVDIQDTDIHYNFVEAIYGQNVDTFTLTNVEFKGNYADDESGAAGWFENSGNYTFTDCDFIDNYADWRGGAVVFYKVQATINGGKFQGNYSSSDYTKNNDYDGGAIYVYGTGGGVNCTNVQFKENYCFVGNNTKTGGIIRLRDSGNFAYFDKCVFDGNYSYRTRTNGSNNVDNRACAAIINSWDNGTVFYFNACEFKWNYSGLGNSPDETWGGLKGQVISSMGANTIALNNCYFHDNYGRRNSDDCPWIYTDNASNTLIMSNCTVIGDRVIRKQSTPKNKKGVIFLESDGNYSFINSIICSKYSDGKSIGCGSGHDVSVYYCKVSPKLDADTQWTDTDGFGDDYWADASCFSGWSGGYTWNGTMTGTNSSSRAGRGNVGDKVKAADENFWAWLKSIGAFDSDGKPTKDIEERSVPTPMSPGCYQPSKTWE